MKKKRFPSDVRKADRPYLPLFFDSAETKHTQKVLLINNLIKVNLARVFFLLKNIKKSINKSADQTV